MATSNLKQTLAVQNNKLDVFVKQSDQWYQIFLSLIKEKTDLQNEVKSFQAEKGRLNDTNGRSEKDVARLHELTDNLHKQLNVLIKVEDEVRDMKIVLTERELKIQTIQKELETSKENHQQNMEKVMLENAEKISEITNIYKNEKNEAVGELKRLLKEKDEQNKHLQESLHELEEKKQREVVCLKMECETKMKLLQRQKNQTTLSKQSCDQEIFRKKLTHLKEDYEKKITDLQETVSSLEWKLSMNGVRPLKERQQLFNKKKKS